MSPDAQQDVSSGVLQIADFSYAREMVNPWEEIEADNAGGPMNVCAFGLWSTASGPRMTFLPGYETHAPEIALQFRRYACPTLRSSTPTAPSGPVDGHFQQPADHMFVPATLSNWERG